MATQASDPASSPALPGAEPTDSEQVLLCLETAQKLWQDGQYREAVRSLQRGAEAAEEDGNDLRALSLARFAADLSAQVGSAPSVPPPPVEEVRHVPVPPPLPAEAAASPVPPSVREASPASVEPAPPSAAPAPAAAAPSHAPAPAQASASPAATHPSATPAAPSARPVHSATAAPRRSAQPSAAPAKRPTPSATPSAEAAPAAAKSSGNGAHPTPATGREVRVSVRRSTLDEELYVVRPLRPGSKLPYGAEEAVLVFPESGTPTKDH